MGAESRISVSRSSLPVCRKLASIRGARAAVPAKMRTKACGRHAEGLVQPDELGDDPVAEPVGMIDGDGDGLAGVGPGADQGAEAGQGGRTLLGDRGKPEAGADRGQQGVEGRRGDELAAGGGDAHGQNRVAVRRVQEGVDDAGLAGAGLAEQQDERPAGADGVLQVGEGLALPGGGRGDGHLREPSSRRDGGCPALRPAPSAAIAALSEIVSSSLRTVVAHRHRRNTPDQGY